MTYTLALRGRIPSKKNNWKPKRGGGMYLTQDAANLIAPLLLQAQAAWQREPLVDPDLAVYITTSEASQDRDNIFTCVLDLLQKAGVIRNDNIRWFNGLVQIYPAVLCQPGDEHIRLVFTERQKEAKAA